MARIVNGGNMDREDMDREQRLKLEASMSDDILDIEANMDDKNEVTISFNKYCLGKLIENLTYIYHHEILGGHIHLDDDSGLRGNIDSVIIIRVRD